MSVRRLSFSIFATIPMIAPGWSTPVHKPPHSFTVGTNDSSVVTRRPTVLFIGNSLTAGEGLRPNQTFPHLIEQLADSAHIPLTSVNTGVSGATTVDVLQWLDSLVRIPSDIVVIEIGANDGFANTPVDTIKAHIETIIDRIRSAKPKVPIALMQMGVPPDRDPSYAIAFSKIYPVIEKEKSITLFPFLLLGVYGHPNLVQADGQHPNAKGEQIVARNVWHALEPLVQSYYSAAKTP